jgi:hypothetical protein
MIPGPDRLYQCPHCGSCLTRKSIASGNASSSEFFSDGKLEAPMLPLFPDLTKCKKCNSIVWLSDLTELKNCYTCKGGVFLYIREWLLLILLVPLIVFIIGLLGDFIDRDSLVGIICSIILIIVMGFTYIIEYLYLKKVNFLEIKDLCRALEITNDKEKEIIIRTELWQAFNDRVRKRRKKKMFINENDKNLWEQNCKILISLLDKNDINQKITIAELYRNLGQFDDCLELINSLPDDNCDWLKNKYKLECDAKNQKVFRMQ